MRLKACPRPRRTPHRHPHCQHPEQAGDRSQRQPERLQQQGTQPPQPEAQPRRTPGHAYIDTLEPRPQLPDGTLGGLWVDILRSSTGAARVVAAAGIAATGAAAAEVAPSAGMAFGATRSSASSGGGSFPSPVKIELPKFGTDNLQFKTNPMKVNGDERPGAGSDGRIVRLEQELLEMRETTAQLQRKNTQIEETAAQLQRKNTQFEETAARLAQENRELKQSLDEVLRKLDLGAPSAAATTRTAAVHSAYSRFKTHEGAEYFVPEDGSDAVWELPEGAVIVDAGFHPEKCGDVDLEAAAPRSSAYTPVPGGVGPMTISTLITQTVHAAEKAAGIGS